MTQKLGMRLLSVLLLLATLVSLLPVNAAAEQAADLTETQDGSATTLTEAGTAQTRGYYDVGDRLPVYEDCVTTQGLAVLGDYVYTFKRNTAQDKAVIFRTNRFDGTTEQMNFDGALFADYLYHGNDMCAAQVGNDSYLFVSTMKKSADALVCYKIQGTTLNLVGIFDIYTESGADLACSGLDVYKVNGNEVSLFIAQGGFVFMHTLDMTDLPEALYCQLAFRIDEEYMRQVAREACGNPELEVTVQGSAFCNDTYYMPLTLHHTSMTAGHSDSFSVIVAYPGIEAAVAETNQSVKASLEDTVYISDAGEMYFEVESLDVVHDVMYFNTNRVHIDGVFTTVSVVLDPGMDMEIFNRRAAFSQDGLYQVSGAAALTYVFYDPGDGSPITVGQYGDDPKTYFGFESNGEGYYYIRSMTTKKYLTVNDDCTVSAEDKREGDLRQLFCLTQANWPNNAGRVAIFSLYNYQYLNNTDVPRTLVTTTGTKAFQMHPVKDTAALADILFDEQLYAACYPEETAGMTKEQMRNHYDTMGKANGYIASLFFDPEYYMEHNPWLGLQTAQEAYDHFLNTGFWEGRQGSLFFSCNEYLHSGNDKLKGGDYPNKLFYIKHFRQYGAHESLTREDRYGSDEFHLEEFVAKYNLNVTNGYEFLVDYISKNVALSRVSNEAELKELLFDPAYYAEKNPTLNTSNTALMNFPGDTFEDKLLYHWEKYGQSEGREASPYFNSAYYISNNSAVASNHLDAYNHFVTVGFWEGRAGALNYANGMYLEGLNPEKSSVCLHRQTVTATAPMSTCTSNGASTTYCCDCAAVLKVTKLPALPHVDEDGNELCDVCQTDLAGAGVLINKVGTLLDPVATNEYLDIRDASFTSAAWDGTYYLVQSNSDGAYRVLDVLNQSNKGTMKATTVTLNGNSVLGAHPDMAVSFQWQPDGTYLLSFYNGTYLGYGGSTTGYTYGEVHHKYFTTSQAMTVEKQSDQIRISKSISGTIHYLTMQNINGTDAYRFNSASAVSSENSFMLYRLRTDLLHTEDLYATLQQAAGYVTPNSTYDSDTYEKFFTCVEEAVALYEQYNGVELTGSQQEERESLQNALDAKERELINLMSILKINLQGNTIRYFPADMYNYNEDEMNALTMSLTNAAENGFLFESAKNKGDNSAAFSNHDGSTAETVDGKVINAQMYSIYSGLAAAVLDNSVSNPPFANSVVAADYWSTTPIENVKEVYTNLEVPFLYEDGYYVLNSDTNAVFFEGEPASGARLAISERPAAYYWGGGLTNGASNNSFSMADYTSYKASDGYVTGFQPFAKMTKRPATAYAAEASVFSDDVPVDSYLIEGMAFDSNADKFIAATGSGAAVWGFGMKLSVEFIMTKDGYLADGSGRPITFEFSGDDDVWVYIDGKLVLDIGGSHDAIQGKIDFSDGTVTVRSDKYDRVRDKNTSGYGRVDAVKYDPAQISSEYAILTNQMYQKNIYTEVFRENVSQFANSGELHTLTIYYMDRGKGRTNSTIKFNLPQTDVVVVEKEISPYYADPKTGKVTDDLVPEATLETLRNESYGFTLYSGNTPVKNAVYQVKEKGLLVGTGTTDANGHFTITANQTAEFLGMEIKAENVYRVEEDAPDSRWIAPTYTFAYSGTDNIPPASGAGNSYVVQGEEYISETLLIRCKNTYAVYVPLEAEPIDLVLDYGKAVEFNVRERAFISAFTEELLDTVPLRAELANPDNSIYGEVTLLDSDDDGLEDSLRYTPKEFLSKIITVNCIFQFTSKQDGAVRDAVVPVRIVPATSVYYETDFSDTAIKFTVKNGEETVAGKNQWEPLGENNVAEQDMGEIKENIYDFVFDRGGEIPSNAFFADFNNDDAAKYRYKTSPVYANTGSTSGGTNYDDAVGSTGVVYNWTAGQTSTPKLWWQGGRMSLDFTGTDGHLWLRTSGTLSYHPEPTHYLQVRFRMLNIVSTNEYGQGTGLIEMRYFTPNDMSNTKPPIGGQGAIPAKAFTDGEYVTVSFPLSGLGSAVTTIASIRLDFRGIAKKSADVNGNLMIDYIYCGPDNSQETHLSETQKTAAIKPEYEVTSNIPASEYLFYDFTNSAVASARYSSSQYLRKDHDSNNKTWAVATSTRSNSDSLTNYAVHLNHTWGYIAANCCRRLGGTNNTEYSCYIAPTQTDSEFPWQKTSVDYSAHYTLTYKPNKNKNNYCYVRFKFWNCTYDDRNLSKTLLPGVACSLIDTTGTAKHSSNTYSWTEDNQYFEVKIPLNTALNGLNGTIKNFYLRFYHVRNTNTDVMGKVYIDYIYIGPEVNDISEIRGTKEKTVFIDFNDTTYDNARYAGHTYGGLELDKKDSWKYDNFNGDFSIDKDAGLLTLKPAAGFSSGRIEANTYDNQSSLANPVRAAMMNYTMTGNDFVVVRMKHTNLNAGGSPKLEFVVGTGSKCGQPGESGVVAKTVTSSLSSNNNQKWVTYVMNLKDVKSALNSKITYFRLGFSGTSFNNGNIQIDYIYIGPKLNAAPPEDTIYFGFDNSDSDKARYNSATYGNINYDDPANVNKFGFVNVESASIDNNYGTMTMVARPESTYSTFGFTPNNTLNYHPKDKTVQMRFKLKDFVPTGSTDPYVFLQYGDDKRAGITFFSKKYVTNGKYVTVTVDLTEALATEFNQQNTTNKLRFIIGGIKNADNTQGKITLDYAYIGPKDGKLGGEMTYGYDSHYVSGGDYSGGRSYYVEGLGVAYSAYIKDEDGNYVLDEAGQKLSKINYAAAKKFTESTFTFTGTGFDLISRTGLEQASLRVYVCDSEGLIKKTVSVVCKGENELSQIPVVSIDELDYGTYTVHVFVNEAYDYDNDNDPSNGDNFNGALDRGGQFYFDAIRVYNPIDLTSGTEDAKLAYELYQQHGEADAKVQEIRELLLKAENFAEGDASSVIDGIVFVDKGSEKPSVETYREVGPNNEVYLTLNHGISFLLEASGVIPASVDVGAKLANGTSAEMLVAVGSKTTTTATEGQRFEIATATQQNYSLKFNSTDWFESGGKYYTYVTVSNVGSGTLSLTDIKCAYGPVDEAAPVSKSIRFLATGDLLLPPAEEPAPADPLYVEELTMKSVNLDLASEIAINFNGLASILDEYTDVYAVYSAEGKEDVIVREYFVSGEGADLRYNFAYEGLTALDLALEVYVTVYGTNANGELCYGPTKSYSILRYCTGAMDQGNNDAVPCANLLMYGNAAQLFKNVAEEDLIVNQLSDAQRAKLDQYAYADDAINVAKTSKVSQGSLIKFSSQNVDMLARITMVYKMNFANYTGSLDVVTFKVTYTDVNGNAAVKEYTMKDLTYIGDNTYELYFAEFYSTQMREIATCEIYIDGVLHASYGNSIENYCYSTLNKASNSDVMKYLATRMSLYGDASYNAYAK